MKMTKKLTKFDGVKLERLDAAENYFFLRELEQILSEQFDVEYAVLKSRQFIPTDGSIDPGAESVTYRMWDKFGEAQRISDHSDDVPLVNVKGAESTQRMQDYGAGFSYTIPEIQRAALVNRPLERDRAEAARRTLAQKLDSVLFSGDTDAGLYGLMNVGNSAADTYTVPNGLSGSPLWTAKTPDEILADLNGMVQQVITNSKEIEKPSLLILPTAQHQYISTKARSPVSDTTILKFFQGNRPDVRVESWERLATAGSGGTDRAIAFDPTKTKVRALMAIEFEMDAPQKKNWSYVINCRMRTGGVISPYPKSIIYADGI